MIAHANVNAGLKYPTGQSRNSGYLSSTPTKTHETSQSRLANPNNSTLSDEEKRLLSSWGLPDTVQRQYASNGIISMFQWQVECLSIGEVLEVNTIINSNEFLKFRNLQRAVVFSSM